jgi:hypothetical protein
MFLPFDRYNATDHSRYDEALDHCPAGAFCRNCMPVHDVETCWAVKTPILYKVERYGKVSQTHTKH